jgi:parallel beta-helix repeat protein
MVPIFFLFNGPVNCSEDICLDHGPALSTSRTWVVALDGSGDFTSVQGAIDAASAGDIIRVYNGTYQENVVIGKRLDIIGNGSDRTIIDGNRADHRDTISITADHVNLSGFQARNTYFGHEFAGIGIRSSWNLVMNNKCLDNDYGILIIGGSNNLVKGNNASNNNRNGLHMRFTSTNRIEGNTFSYSTTTQGIYLEGGSGNLIRNNTCCSNYKYGISLYLSDDNELTNNSCCGNSLFDGLNLYKANMNDISSNNCSENGLSGISISYSSDNAITMNSVRSNIYGIRAIDTTDCEVHQNMIEHNSGFGVNVSAHTGPPLNCTMNWWGNASGPYHPDLNPEGKGDKISDYVDFIPWMNMSKTNRPPRILTPDVVTVLEDQVYSVIYGAIDPDLDPIQWSFWTDSTWLNWDQSARSLSGIPNNTDVGNWMVRLGISDGHDGIDEHLFNIEVKNTPPVITTTDITEIVQDSLYSIDYDSTDDQQGNITWNLTTNNGWLTKDEGTGLLTGIPGNDDVGTSNVTVTVHDGNGGMDTHEFELQVIDRNDPPTNGPVPNLLVWEEDKGTSLDLNEWFMDIDGDILSFDVNASGNITVFAIGGGWFDLGSVENWSGNGSLHVSCHDAEFSLGATLGIMVTSVNDAPSKATITIPEGDLFEDRPILLTGAAEDPDLNYGDVLSFDWYSNISGYLGNGPVIGPYLPAGSHRIALSVNDSKGDWTSTWRIIDILTAPSNGTDPDDNGTGTNDSIDDDGPSTDDDDGPDVDDDDISNDDDVPMHDKDDDRHGLWLIILVLASSTILVLIVLLVVNMFARDRRDRRADLWEE